MRADPSLRHRFRAAMSSALPNGLVSGVFALLMIPPGAPAQASAGPARTALMIVRNDPPRISGDPAVQAHLTTLGYRITTSEGFANAPDPCAFDLVIISSTVRSYRFTADRTAIARWRDMGVPLVTWENDLLDDLRMTGLRRDGDFGELETGHYAWLVRAPHPLAAGLPAGATVWTDAKQPAGWGTPGPGADVVMTVPGEPDKVMLFGYERGATMGSDFTAPARRVFIGLENATFPHLTTDGRRLFDAAIGWAAAGTRNCPPIAGQPGSGRRTATPKPRLIGAGAAPPP